MAKIVSSIVKDRQGQYKRRFKAGLGNATASDISFPPDGQRLPRK